MMSSPLDHAPRAASWTSRESILATIAAFNAFVAIVAVAAFMNSDGTGVSASLLRPAPPPLSYHLLYATALADAKYIDLTHTISPDMPVWAAFDVSQLRFSTALAGSDGGMGADFIQKGDPFSYAKQGFTATQVTLPTDQLGTQLDPPAHWNEYGATISDLPPTFTLRPLCVIDISGKHAAAPGYHAQVEDVLAWEAAHGRVPAGSAVFFRTDYWGDAWPVEPTPLPGVGLAALKFLHEERAILFHGHEPLDTDTTPTLEGEAWLMHNDYAQAEGVANLHLVPESGCLLSVGFAKIGGGAGGYARFVAVCPPTAPHGLTVADAPGAPLPRQDAPLRRGANGVLAPSPGATPTVYCAPENPSSLGCPPNGWSEPPATR